MLLAIFLLLSSGANPTHVCHPPAAEAASGSAQQAVEELVAAFNAQDLALAMSRMWDDVILAAPGRNDARRDGIEAAFRQRWQKGPRAAIEIDIEEICEVDALAVIRLTWTASYTTAEGTVVTTRERDTETWVRENARWKLKRGISFQLKEPAR